MRRSTFKALATVAVVAALFVPAASAGRQRHVAVRVRLALLPLSKAQIGLRKVDGPFPLAHDSGPVTNVAAADISFTGSPSSFKKLGRVGGYMLDYGHAGGCGCVTRVLTSVERYKTTADAKKGLAFWRKDDTQVVRLNVESGFTVDAHTFVSAAGHPGMSRFEYFVEFNAGPFGGAVQVVDERFTEGRYVGEVEIYSGTQTPGSALVPKLARMLDKRLRLALVGRLHGGAVRLPAKLKAGPPPGGPDLSALGLRTTDLAPGPAALGIHSYFVDPLALSEYEITFQPGGRYATVGQKIEWYSSASEAAFRSVYDEAFSAAIVANRVQQPTITSVNLDNINFGERGTVVSVPGASVAIVALASGQATDLVVAQSQTPIQPSDVQDLAQSMQTRLNAGVSG